MFTVLNGGVPTTPQQVLDKLVSKGGRITNRHIVTGDPKRDPYVGKCKVTVIFDIPNIPVVGNALAYAGQLVGMSWVNLVGIVPYTASNTGRDYIMSLYFDPSFCDGPSGTSPATNAVSSPNHASESGGAANMVVLLVLLAVVGYFVFPRFGWARVRI